MLSFVSKWLSFQIPYLLSYLLATAAVVMKRRESQMWSIMFLPNDFDPRVDSMPSFNYL